MDRQLQVDWCVIYFVSQLDFGFSWNFASICAENLLDSVFLSIGCSSARDVFSNFYKSRSGKNCVFFRETFSFWLVAGVRL